MTREPLAKVYEPKAVEEQWYPMWLEHRFFHADDKSEQKKPFSLVIPPPNVTGSLHMGHALNATLHDIVTRFWRMRGYNACWLPGTDHAGIATQHVVEKQLQAEGLDRHTIGREAFIERVWQWKKQYGDRIVHQLQRLGASCDWDRERFTMDEGLSRAVREVFIHLYEDGLIYRGEYLINWCPRCLTALSDLEVEHEEVNGQMWHIKYPVVGRQSSVVGNQAVTDDRRPTTDDAFLVVATTRPETMLGDVAVAVHPDDERYAALIGATIRLPLTDRAIPVIADRRVDRAFGTGAVKVTPAHDLNDFQIGNEHRLPRINIFTPDAKMNEAAGAFQGLDRFEARQRVIAALEVAGAVVKVEDHRHSVGHCYRCKTVVEPSLSKQWFVKVGPLAEKAVAAVRQGRTKFVPRHWTKTYYDWMERIQDWCISRQIWWGHRIPAWYCPRARQEETRDEETRDEKICQPIVAREAPTRCPTCGATAFTQDPDVLDTWFSSALWPFSTFGWPDHTVALKTFYPTSVLITGFDIIFFWVARMMMMGLRFMGDVPFKTIYIHALVRDPLGQKMSKSKGNVVDPLSIIDEYGTDAFRFTLAALAAQGRDIKMSVERVEGYRNFCNKLWNAARYLFLQTGEGNGATEGPPEPTAMSLADKWIANRVNHVVRDVTKALERYEFDLAARALYQFTWHELCDWYVETTKPRLRPEADPKGRQATLATLRTTFETLLRLLHPFMPFLTEELWQQMVGGDQPPATSHQPRSIVVAPWPVAVKHPLYTKEAKTFQLLADVVSAIRTIRSEHRVAPAKRVTAFVRTTDPAAQRILGTHGAYLRELARLDRLELRVAPIREHPVGAAIAGPVEVCLPLADLIDLPAEEARLRKETERLARAVEGLRERLQNPQFVERAPAEVVEEERERLARTTEELAKMQEALGRLLPEPQCVSA